MVPVGGGASGDGGEVTMGFDDSGLGKVKVKVMIEWTADNEVSIATEKCDSNWRCSVSLQVHCKTS